jgi:hypothetical protein
VPAVPAPPPPPPLPLPPLLPPLLPPQTLRNIKLPASTYTMAKYRMLLRPGLYSPHQEPWQVPRSR